MPKCFDHFEFTVEFPLCEDPISEIKKFSYIYFVAIHYTLMKVSSNIKPFGKTTHQGRKQCVDYEGERSNTT